MRTNVLATNNPWFMGYTNLLADSHSSSAYPMAGPVTTIYRDAITATLPTAFQDDCGGAYQNALLWYLTGDSAHASEGDSNSRRLVIHLHQCDRFGHAARLRLAGIQIYHRRRNHPLHRRAVVAGRRSTLAAISSAP